MYSLLIMLLKEQLLMTTDCCNTHPPVIVFIDSKSRGPMGCHFHVFPQSHWEIHITQLQEVSVRSILVAASNRNLKIPHFFPTLCYYLLRNTNKHCLYGPFSMC